MLRCANNIYPCCPFLTEKLELTSEVESVISPTMYFWSTHANLHAFSPPFIPRFLCLPQLSEIAGSVYPQEYEALPSKMAIANADIGFLLSNACILTTIFYNSLILDTVGPLVILFALAFTFDVSRSRGRSQIFGAAQGVLKKNHMSVVIFNIFSLHCSVSFTILQTFACDNLDNGKAYLRAD